MKAYKATYNGKCIDINYEIGKTYTLKGKIIMCNRGFHYCENIDDLTIWYDFTKNYKYNEEIKVFEIEDLGETIKDNNKSVTNKIKIVRELSKKDILKGIEKIFIFDENNNLILTKLPNGYIIEYKYDKKNNMIWKKSPSGDIKEYKYDENNNVIWQKDPDGDIVEYKYDDNNNVIWEKDFNGYIFEWKYKFDENNNVIWKKFPDEDIVEYKYDDNNNVIWVKYPFGEINEYKYDEKNNLIWKKDDDGEIFEYEYTDKTIIKKENNKIIEEITIS